MDPSRNAFVPPQQSGVGFRPPFRPPEGFQHRGEASPPDFGNRGIGRTQSAFPEHDRERDREREWTRDKPQAYPEASVTRSPNSMVGGRDRSDFEPPRRVFSEDSSAFKGIRKTGSSTARPLRKEVSAVREEGIICSVKDQFGFIKCVDRDDELFFHFSELPRESRIEVGLEVEFSVATDTRNGKLSGVNLVELPKGTVILEDTDPEIRTGAIIKEVRDEGEFGAGEIETSDGNILKFSTRNLAEPKVSLKVGDEVKFHTVINRRSKTRSATEVVIYRFGGVRETGIIHSLKDTFGFIDCSETPISLFFHFRDVCLLQVDQQELFVGMEVEFTHGLDKTKKPIATRIRALPKGTVQFETVLPEKVRGMVTRQLANMGSRPHPEEMGLIKLIDEDNTSLSAAMKPITPASSASFPSIGSSGSGVGSGIGLEKLVRLPSITSSPSQGYDMNIFPFTSKDLTDIKSNPKEGDEVTFNVVIKKRQQRKRATNVIIVKEAPEMVEHGVIASVHKSYGHIVCLEREEDMFFHFTDIIDNQPDVKPEDINIGMELEFRVIIDPRNHKKKAVNIKILTKGSLPSETVLPDRYHGVVFRESRPGQGQTTFGLRRRDECGLIDFDDPSKGGKETLPFIHLDLKSEHQRDRVQLWPGDEVEFSIGIGKKTQQRYATNISRIKSRELPREKGTVSSIKNYFGFLSSPSRDEEIYFHFSELEPIMDKKEIEKVRVGQEFEYSIARDSWADNKPIAVMLKVVPKAAKPEDNFDRDSRYYGVVEREPRKRGQFDGRITMKSGVKDDDLICFDLEDVDKRFSLKKGDRIEFSYIPGVKEGEKRAAKILLMRENGTVGSPIKNSTGVIIAEDKSIIHFNEKDIEGGVALQEGDSVEFLRVFNGRLKDFNAVDIKRTKEAHPGTTPIVSSSSSDTYTRKGSKSEKVYVVRNPKVADSGPAFGTGRGRPLNVERSSSGSFSGVSSSSSGSAKH